MAVQKPVAEAWVKATGKPIIEGYGLSETSPVLTCNRGDITEWTGTIGLPLPSTDISIRDEDGHDLQNGERGEICARGPQVMLGYWRRPEETAKAMTADGYFRTGDIGVMDDSGPRSHRRPQEGHDLRFRLQGVPQRGRGSRHEPGRRARMCIGRRAGQTSGEAGKLFAVRKNPSLTADELRAFLVTRLASYKVPKQIEFRDELPKTNVGKILRRVLRDEDASTPAN